MKTLPPVALGTWSWGTGFAGGDTVFGNHLSDTQMAEVFTAAMSKASISGIPQQYMVWGVPRLRWEH